MWELITYIGSMLMSNIFGMWRENNARQENYKVNELAAQNADKRTRALYSDISSPAAQKENLEKAGLSPSLYYSGGVAGSSGMTGAQAAGASGISPNVYGLNAQDLLAKAQIDKTKAETRKINAETDTELGENERGKQEIYNMIAQTENYKAMGNYAESQNELLQLTKESSITQAVNNAKMAALKAQQSYNELIQSGIEVEVSQATKDARIDKQKESVKLIIAQRLKNESDIKLQESQIEEISNRISLMYDEAMREWAMTDAMMQNAETFATEIEQKQRQFELSLDLELDKWGFDKEHWFKNKLIDISGDLIHAGGYIIGLSMMKSGKSKIGDLKVTKKKGNFAYGKFNPQFNGEINGVKYKGGLPIVPQVYF